VINSLTSIQARGQRASPASLQAAGLSEPQAQAITELAQATTDEAADRLRAEFARWHAYLALYVVSQLAIVVLAVLLVQQMQGRIETRVGPPERSDIPPPRGTDSW